MKTNNQLRGKLQDRDGHMCHYCGIQDADFLCLWGEFYGLPYRGRRLEVERKETVVIRGRTIERVDPEHTLENCVLACALCNMAKSNMFTYDEFRKVGKVIQEIWQRRKESGLSVKATQD